ncbi:NADH-quinone oxidoreductase protein [Cinnamomum micranthum f. kanehirae]|uniref:NADH-quinone oxidoreductase protein n=1 Tax=Cinnamomum micranthum f. kanehirae TaxID=337451 RepID=A0A443Q493_9MAGN|nr:NADH-quinone oxidoreductase protein [Cinnamomum micranthum f. kanehirae]
MTLTVERATHECCRVGRANNSNAFAQFFEQESQRYLTFTMIRTPMFPDRMHTSVSNLVQHGKFH